MSSYRVKPFRTILFTMATAALVLTSCGADSDPLDDNGEDTNASDSIVIGSQAYYSNEIIAEIYAQVLENEGFEVEREFQIGQREVYMPELEDGELDLLPDYTGNLVQYYQDDADTGSPEEVHQQAQEAMPDELQVLDFAEATDQDSYTVTSETADKYDLESIGDLSDVGDSVSMAANSEFESRPYGPDGADDVYGVTVKGIGGEDSGGPLTVGALLDGAEATDQDSYTVTSETADKYDLESIGDLSDVGDSVSMAANSEFESRPYGPDGADDVYGVTVKVIGVEDSAGPLTVGALLDGDVEVADIYTSSPSIAEEDLVVLDDPEHLILPQNVVPVASAELDDKAVDIVNDVQADLSLDELIQLNTRSVEDEASASDIASQWLEDRD